ncbi:MAG TPA: hypothetical protein VFI19_10775 [Nocardioides sp.]|nr:hypothetical protein [Nocardioides sp.]
MTEPTPPPERPLPEESRARIRGELLAHAHDNRSWAPRWLVPAGAGAAVALVAGLAFWAVSTGGGDAAGTPVTGGGTSSAPDTPSSTVPTSPPTPIQVATRPCPEELTEVLPGAQPAFEFPDNSGGGTTTFFVKGDRFVLCDVREGTTTVQQPMPLTPRADETTYAVSTLNLGGPGHRTVRVGGGVVPAGTTDFDVAYTFPDGQVQHATTATDPSGRTWWLMVHAYDAGGGNELDKAEITVTVTQDGSEQTYRLSWGIYTCAQANHGC